MRPPLAKYTIAALPFAVPFGSWQVARLIGHVVGCTVPSMPPVVCMYEYFDVQFIVGTVAWWGMVLSLPGLVISGACLALMRRAPSMRRDHGGNGQA